MQYVFARVFCWMVYQVTVCVCGHELTTSHALSCPSGGYPTACHNEVRDVIADAMRSVCRDVETEPELLPFDNEDLAGRTTSRSLDARVDLRLPGFWTRQQRAYFDIRVTHTEAGLMSVKEARKHLETHEREKKGSIVRESMSSIVEHLHRLSFLLWIWQVRSVEDC